MLKRILSLLVSLACLLGCFTVYSSKHVTAQEIFPIVLEAEDGVLNNGATIYDSEQASGGKKVGYLGGDPKNAPNGSVTFEEFDIVETGIYNLTVYYFCDNGSKDRYFEFRINGEKKDNLYFEEFGLDFDELMSKTFQVVLEAGKNTIWIGNDSWYAPDIDRIEISPKESNSQPDPTTKISYEAEDGIIADGAAIYESSQASQGKKVGNLGGDPKNAPNGSVTFEDIDIKEDGVYNLTIYYFCDSGSKDRYFEIKINGEERDDLYFDDFGSSFDEVLSKTFEVVLEAGKNTIWIGNNSWYAPDIDKIEIWSKEDTEQPEPDNKYEYEAENATLGNGAVVRFSPYCSGDRKVDDIGGDNNGYVLFEDIKAEHTGTYEMLIYYCTETPREYYITVNGVDKVLSFGPTQGWDKPGVSKTYIELNEGVNTIKIHNPNGYAPNLDKIIIRPYEQAEFGDVAILENKDKKIEYSLDTGYFNIYFDSKQMVKNGFSSYKLEDSIIKSIDYEKREYETVDIQDDFGKGKKLIVTSTHPEFPSLKQSFRVYDGLDYILTDIAIISNGEDIRTNWIAPIQVMEIGGVDIGSYGDNRVILNPYDNDQWVEFESRPVASSGVSYEVMPIFDNDSRNALIIGSITHDTWKSAIEYSGSNYRLNELTMYAGATPTGRDQCEHGFVSGKSISSPTIFTGYYSDWRDGMEDYAKANAVITPKMPWQGEVPFGWNSWGEIQSSIDLDSAIYISDYIKENLQDVLRSKDGVTYINLDSYWDNMSKEELRQFVEHCEKNGQKAGIYWGPFVSWYDTEAQLKANTVVPKGVKGDQYTFYDIALKDHNGKVLQKLDGAFTLDPTHPGTKARIDYYIDNFKELGFSYIKLDFLVGASLEGDHYDPQVTTGTQAYNMGMQYLVDRIDGTMFISLAMAPLFPNQYAHGRRIACDTFYSIENTKYQLSALTYGFWINQNLYEYSDPDHIVITGGDFEEARSRVNSGIISGTIFLAGDDFRKEEARERASILYKNDEVMEVARIGKSFRPIEGNIIGKSPAAQVFVMEDSDNYYAAVFNYSRTESDVVKVDFDRAGFDVDNDYIIKDLWTGEEQPISGNELEVALNPMESKLFKISKEQNDDDDSQQPDDDQNNNGDNEHDKDQDKDTNEDTPDNDHKQDNEEKNDDQDKDTNEDTPDNDHKQDNEEKNDDQDKKEDPKSSSDMSNEEDKNKGILPVTGSDIFLLIPLGILIIAGGVLYMKKVRYAKH